jgi:hypothetical protein
MALPGVSRTARTSGKIGARPDHKTEFQPSGRAVSARRPLTSAPSACAASGGTSRAVGKGRTQATFASVSTALGG